jgi:hypothetical protein
LDALVYVFLETTGNDIGQLKGEIGANLRQRLWWVSHNRGQYPG